MTFTGTLTDNTFTGTYTSNGGCANGEHGSVTGIRIPSIGNTLKGTFTGLPVIWELACDRFSQAEFPGLIPA